ncbi:hypothetical protein EV659_108133 [Rhodothalassium salexigens DSM 2132]|uniref:Uncharacterized protein n=1 Tax=Rhodothalassium salexigens DSM 2132 TaxID=1188247 RepID=A0A4R2PCW8_RHOSA|nr:hypothetical protein [Rhodothalassium salexigens]MBB4212159.1 hypothetical protein [Rhodothalassium salexigens DSM 2132]TCP33033.1 hypothetical protein EV659_108133 [Rhodothalassium salexigens DSM 2132]
MPFSTVSVSIRRFVAVLVAWLVLAAPALCDCGPAHGHDHGGASPVGEAMALSAGPCDAGTVCPAMAAGGPGAPAGHPMTAAGMAAAGMTACDGDGCGLCAADMPQWSGPAERSGDPFWWGAGGMAVLAGGDASPRAVAGPGGVAPPAGPPPRVPETLVALSVLLLA